MLLVSVDTCMHACRLVNFEQTRLLTLSHLGADSVRNKGSAIANFSPVLNLCIANYCVIR